MGDSCPDMDEHPVDVNLGLGYKNLTLNRRLLPSKQGTQPNPTLVPTPYHTGTHIMLLVPQVIPVW